MQRKEPSQNMVEWEPVYYSGCLFCYVDKTNPAHLKMMNRAHGKKEWVEIWTDKRQEKIAA